ncbi:MAG: hypothetical protein K2O62_02425 [Clostridia bacterium]|nr:hypothetical protein [Clostridia bacterium]
MNKLTKLLSVFAIAGAIGAGVAGAAGCHKHTYEKDWTGVEDGHYHVATCHPEAHDKIQDHTPGTDGKCTVCNYDLNAPTPGEKLVVKKEVTGLMIEGVTQETITLSATKKSHTIDKSAIHVYFATGANADQKGTEVPADNLVLELKDSAGAAVSSWENITKDGAYRVNASLKNAEMEAGATVTVNDLKKTVTVTVSNPVVANSLTKTSTGDTTLEQGASDTISSKWTFEVTYTNGDKQAVAAADCTITGIDTMTAGDKTATVTYGTNQTLTVNYTVTGVEGMVTQSYAVNFAKFEVSSSITQRMILSEAGGIYATGKSGGEVQINANSQTYGTKVFSQRFQLRGSPISQGALNGDTIYRTVELKDINKTTTEGATSTTNVTVYARDTSGGRKLQLYKEGENEGKPTLTAVPGEAYVTAELVKNEITVWQFTINDTGTFHIASTSGGIDLYYVQVDKIITGEEGAQNVPLGGEDVVSSLDVVTTGAKTVYKVNDTLDTSAVTANVTLANDVTAEKKTQAVANADLSFDTSKVDMTKLGTYPVTVTYGTGEAAVSKSYNITVETEVDGVKGATANLKTGVNTPLENASAKLPIKKGDIEVAAVWTKDAVEGLTITYTVSYNETEIDETTATEFGKGTYELAVAITITDGTNTTTINTTVELKVEVEGEVSAEVISVEDVAVGTSLRDNAITGTKFNLGATTAGGDTKVAANTTGAGGTATATAEDGSGLTFTKGWLPGGGGRELTVTAKADITVTIYFTICNGDFSTTTESKYVEKTTGGDLEWTITPAGGTAGAKETDDKHEGNKSSHTAYAVTIELNEGDVLTLTASSNRVVLFAVSAV